MKVLATHHLEKTTESFIDKLNSQGGKPIYQLEIAEARQVLEMLQAQTIHKLPAKIEDKMIPVGPKGQISIRIIRPQNAEGPLPVTIYFHGGGWILGSKDTHDRLVREIANEAKTAVVFVNYTPSPEANFPIPIEEAYAATRYIAEKGKELGLNPNHLAVVGDSVGGNMAIAVTMLAKERGGPKIDYQILMYPVTNADMDTDSYREFASGPGLTKPAMEWFWKAYAPNAADRRKVLASPLHATIEQLRGLPPALVITDENDVLRDEGEAYAHKLMQAGVNTAAVRYLGTMHDFMLLNPIANSPATRSALELVNSTLIKAFRISEKE